MKKWIKRTIVVSVYSLNALGFLSVFYYLFSIERSMAEIIGLSLFLGIAISYTNGFDFIHKNFRKNDRKELN